MDDQSFFRGEDTVTSVVTPSNTPSNGSTTNASSKIELSQLRQIIANMKPSGTSERQSWLIRCFVIYFTLFGFFKCGDLMKF